MTRVINTKSVSETILFKRLVELNDPNTLNILNNLENICQEACDRIKEMPRYAPQYTLHDEVHFVRVTELMSFVLGDTLSKLNSLEIILLILAAYYHDQGMVPNREEMEKIENDDKFIIYRDSWYLEHPNRNELQNKIKEPNLSNDEKNRLTNLVRELDGAMLTDYLRVTHGERGREIIKNKFNSDERLEVFNVNISGILGNLCQSHCVSVDEIIKSSDLNVDEQVGTYKINLEYLAAVLRLADIMDFDRDRTPEILFKSIHFTSPISIAEWEKHRGVQGWEISKHRIRFTLEFEHPVYEASARRFLNWIDKELSDCKNMCSLFPSEQSQYQLLLPHSVDRSRIRPKDNSYIYHDLEFSLSRDEIVKLLMTDKLYEDPSLCIRELLQNSLDALRFRKSLFKCQDADWNVGEVRFEHSIDENGYEVLKCRDNGVGMDEEIITKFFCKAGRSYYRSPEFERKRVEFRSKGVDFDPCAKFGIGFMSCFMLGDRITIQTKRDYGTGFGKPLIVEINGLGGMLIIREGKSSQEIGTTVTIQKRNKSRIFDHWDDRIKLLDVVQSYAMVTEFPIYADCKIEEIKATISIPNTFEKPITFLEETKIRQQKVIEVEFSKIESQLNGVIRQSFLTDSTGCITVENDEASFIGKSRSGLNKEWCVKLKDTQQEIETFKIRENNTVCVDGILVTGKKGRESFRKKNHWRLGWNNPPIHDNASVLLDVRGEIKPELTPSRIPLSAKSSFEILPGWDRLQEYLNIASGKIWNQVIEECANANKDEEIWKLAVVYSAWFPKSSTDTLFKFLPIPIITNDNFKWEKLGKLSQIKFLSDGKTWELRTSKDEEINFEKTLHEWEITGDERPNLKWHLLNILIFSSEISISDNTVFLNIRKDYTDTEALNSNKFIGRGLDNRCFYVDFLSMDDNTVSIQSYLPLANKKHPLSEIALKNKFATTKDSLQEFATYFTMGIANSIDKNKKEGENDFTLEQPTRWKKRIASLYFDVPWENYDAKLKAPYKIWTEANGWLEITESILKSWASATIHQREY